MSRLICLLKRSLIVLIATSVTVGAREARADEVDQLFDSGTRAFDAHHVDEAYEKLSRAWKLRETFDIAANLSVVERALGKSRDAAEHLAYALRTFPTTAPADRRKAMEKDLAELDAKVGKVVIQVPANTIIQIDGVVIGTSPLPGAIYVEPGTRIIVGEHPSLGGARVEAACAKGKEVTVILQLKPEATGGGGHAAHRSVVPGIVGLTVGALGFGIGGALFAVRGNQIADGKTLGTTSHCQRSDPAGSCPALDKVATKANTTGSAAAGMLVVGGAGLAVGTSLLVWAAMGGESEPVANRAAFTPLVSPTFAGGELNWQF